MIVLEFFRAGTVVVRKEKVCNDGFSTVSEVIHETAYIPTTCVSFLQGLDPLRICFLGIFLVTYTRSENICNKNGLGEMKFTGSSGIVSLALIGNHSKIL